MSFRSSWKKSASGRRVINTFGGLALFVGALTYAGKFLALRARSPELRVHLTDVQGKEMLQAAWDALTPSRAAAPSRELSFSFDAPPPARIFLSASNGDEAATTVLGTGPNATAAERDAVKKFLALKGSSLAAHPVKWLKLSLVSGAPHREGTEKKAGLTLERSLAALWLPGLPELAFVPDEVVLHNILDENDFINIPDTKRFLQSRGQLPQDFTTLSAEKPTVVEAANVESWFTDGAKSFKTYRGHRTFDNVDAPLLRESLTMGGDYLLRSLRQDGRFDYNFIAKTGAPDQDYNILRHAGTAYAMLELYQTFQNPKILAGAERAIIFLKKQLVPCARPDTELLCALEEGEVKLGGTALALVALAKQAEVSGLAHLPADHLGLMRKLGARLRSVQNPKTGEFSQHKQKYPSGEGTDFSSGYYPGEAILGLIRLYAIDPDPKWAAAAARGCLFLIDGRDKGKELKDLDHDHWLLYGLNEVQKIRPDAKFVAHARKIVSAIEVAQNGDASDFRDWKGGFFTDPNSTPAATRAEGLMAARALFLREGLEAEAAKALSAARAAAGFLLINQHREERAMFFKDPKRVIGGIGASPILYDIRIDYVQHAISAMIAIYRAI